VAGDAPGEEKPPMATIQHDLPPSVFAALRLSPKELAREMRIAACVQWYAQGVVSQEKAAEIAGLDRTEFLEELFRRRVPASQVTLEELVEELEHD
jgi:predicted HTH domain antitoxin